MSKGNWSEWLGAAHDTSSSAQTPNYVALTDDTLHHPNNPSAIPAFSNNNYRYAANNPSYNPYHYNPATPSTSHYGQPQYSASYYQQQQQPYHNINYNNNTNNSNTLCPPTDYYALIKNKHKKHKKHKNKRNKEISVPPARPPKPTPTYTISNISHSAAKQYELIVTNVPLQIRSRELHKALNGVKCHLTDFYIPDYSQASTIIIVVKGFVQWRQLSKLTHIEIRGVMCPITPKPLKSLNSVSEPLKKNDENDDGPNGKVRANDNNNELDTEQTVIATEDKQKEESNVTQKGIKKEESNVKEEVVDNEDIDLNEIEMKKEDIDLMARLDALQDAISDKDVNENNDNNDVDVNYYSDHNQNGDAHSINNANMNAIINTENNPSQLTQEIDEHPLHNDNESGNGNIEEKPNDDDDDVFSVKLEVPDVPDIIMSDDSQPQEQDMYFVDDNNTETYNNLNELMQCEQPPIPPQEDRQSDHRQQQHCELAQIKKKKNVFQPLNTDKKKQIARDNLQKALHSARKKKQSLSPIPSIDIHKPQKQKQKQHAPKPHKSTTHSPQKLNHTHNKLHHKRKKLIAAIHTKKNIKNTYKATRKSNVKNTANKTAKTHQYSSKSKGLKLDKNNQTMITIPRTGHSNKCGVKYETRSMFMSKLVQLSCSYHNGMNLLQFKSIALKIEDIMQQHCETTLTYKLCCGQLLKQYRELKNIHKLSSVCTQEYGVDSKTVKPQTPIQRLLLNRQQLEDNGYPIKTAYLDDEYKDFVVTPSASPTAPGQPMYDLLAIDCEMCKTTHGSELTRISIVDAKLMVVYDKLVKPPHEITDYLTEWSGITENLLKGVQRRIADVHDEIFAFMNAETILCGHSLENDLIALKLIHYTVVDTAVLFMKRMKYRNNKRNIGYAVGSGGGRKLSLKHLCGQYLNKSIQCAKGPDGQIVGHSSVEDAISAMQLLQLQLKWEEERNRKLGIGVPDSVTQYVVYGKGEDKDKDKGKDLEVELEGVEEGGFEGVDVDEAERSRQKEMIRRKKKILNRRYVNSPMQQKRFGAVKDGIDLHALYGSNKKTKIDSSKQRFNPNSNKLCGGGVLPKVSKEEMLSNLFEDGLFEKGQRLKVEKTTMDIDCDYSSDSEDLVILSLSKSKNIEADNTEKEKKVKSKESVLRINGRGKKRKLDSYDCSPSTPKTKKRKLAFDDSNSNNLDKLCSADSDLNESLSDSLYLSKNNISSAAPSEAEFNNFNVSVLEEDDFNDYRTLIAMSDDGNDINQDKDEEKDKKREQRKKDKKHRKSKKHKKRKEKKAKSHKHKHRRSRSKTKSKDRNVGKAKVIVLEWCHKYLNPLFKQQQITRKEYTAIAKKSVHKILQSHDIWTSQNIKNLKTKSKHKVIDVIKGYVKKQTHAN